MNLFHRDHLLFHKFQALRARNCQTDDSDSTHNTSRFYVLNMHCFWFAHLTQVKGIERRQNGCIVKQRGRHKAKEQRIPDMTGLEPPMPEIDVCCNPHNRKDEILYSLLKIHT